MDKKTKIEKEFDEFIEKVKLLNTEEIINSVYEIFIKKEIVRLINLEKFDTNLSLETIYFEWLNKDTDGLENNLLNLLESVKNL